MPFFTLLPPESVVDWQLDAFGKPFWIKIREVDAQESDPTKDNAFETKHHRFKIWTRTDWRLFDGDGNQIATGEHGLGEVPIVIVKNRKMKFNPFMGVSAINDIAFINKRIFNLGSLIDEFAYSSAFPMVKMPVTIGQKGGITDVGGTTIFDYPDTSRHAPEFMSPPTEPLEFLAVEVATSIKEIQRLARLEAGFNTDAKAVASGISKSFDWQSTSAVLSEKADAFEEAETSAIRLWHKWLEIDNAEFEVDYPDEFNTKSLSNDLEEALVIQTMQISPSYETEVLKRIVAKHLPKLPEAEALKIIDEIIEQTEKRFDDSNFTSELDEEINNDDTEEN